MTTVCEAFDLPSREEITALGFVVRLEADATEEKNRRLVSDYVLTPAVREALPLILEGLRHTFERGEELGRFIHGSFGSGKSHFMSYLALLLEDHDAAWAKPDPLLRELEGRYRQFVREAKLLTVRIHMLTAGQDSGLDRTVYESFNRTLARHGKPPFEFLHVEGVLGEVRTEAKLFGPGFWVNLENAGIVGSEKEFEEQAKGSLAEREALARAYLEYKGRDLASAGVNPNWADGLQRLAEHAKEHGFKGVVFFIDELLLWMSEKSGPDFKRAINQLNVMVDHADGSRALPLFVFAARQRNISEFFPDMVQDDELYQALDHQAKRFETTTLQDVELRHICRERVLKRRDTAAVQQVVDRLAEDQKKLLPTVLQRADVDYLRDVYPFHPALIEMLIDVSSLMQRERTALRLLYELLVVYHPDLELGQFLPVGRAFAAIFPEAGIEGSRRVAELKAIHRLYYQRFRPAMEQMVRDAASTASGFDESRRHILDQIVKTALLAEVSPRLKGGTGMNVERLVLLNDADVSGELDRGRMARVHTDLLDLSRRVPDLQLTSGGGKPKDAVVGIVLQGANFGEILSRARSKADNAHTRFRTFLEVFLEATGLSERPGFRDGKVEGPVEVSWRGTVRKGWARIANVRDLSNADFRCAPGEEFRLLLDFPWDEVGHTVEEDRQRARDVKRREGNHFTLCWLPRHFSPAEMELLLDLGAAQMIAGGESQDELLEHLGPADRSQVVEQASNLAVNLRAQVAAMLRVVYKDNGIAEALIDVKAEIPHPDLDRNLEHFGQVLLDRHYPEHPQFEIETKTADLRTMCDWLVSAAEAGDQNVPVPEESARILRALGGPAGLDLIELGQTRGRLKREGRYLKAVMERANAESVRWDPIDQALEGTYGFQPAVRNLFLAFLSRAHSYRLLRQPTGEALEPEIDGKPRSNLVLQRAALLNPAQWSLLRELGHALLGGEVPTSHRTLAEQDGYAEQLKKAAEDRRTMLTDLHEQLVALGTGAQRLAEIKDAEARLAPLVEPGKDSYKALEAFLTAWGKKPTEAARAAVQKAGAVLEAVGAIDRTARQLLLRFKDDPAHGAAFTAHLKVLDEMLAASSVVQFVRANIQDWNTKAADLLTKIKPPDTGTKIDTGGGGTGTGSSAPVAVLTKRAVDLSNEKSFEALMKELRKKLAAASKGQVEVDVTVYPKAKA